MWEAGAAAEQAFRESRDASQEGYLHGKVKELEAAATAFSDDPMGGLDVNYSFYENKLHCMRNALEKED